MADYGRTTVGASFVHVENTLQAQLITLPGGEPISSTQAYLRTTNGSTADVKSALYNSSTGALAYESNQLSFTDDTGGWKTITWPATTPAAGTYYISVGGAAIAGGANTVQVAMDTVAATANHRRASAVLGSYPTFPDPVTWDGADDTNDASIYLATSAGAVTPKRMLLLGVG